jgi:chromosome segregation ATPase
MAKNILCFLLHPMDEKRFEECTEKLLKMAESMERILENIAEFDENKLEEFKECVEFIHEKVNRL